MLTVNEEPDAEVKECAGMPLSVITAWVSETDAAAAAIGRRSAWTCNAGTGGQTNCQNPTRFELGVLFKQFIRDTVAVDSSLLSQHSR